MNTKKQVYVFLGDFKTGKSILGAALDKSKATVFDDFNPNDPELKHIISLIDMSKNEVFVFITHLENEVEMRNKMLLLGKDYNVTYVTFKI